MSSLAKINFGWSAYLKDNAISFPDGLFPSDGLVLNLNSDGIQLLSVQCSGDHLLCILSCDGNLVPCDAAKCLKGRWDHFLRKSMCGFPGFKRSFLLRSLGQNTKTVVRNYIRSQVDKSDLVDPLYRESMKKLCFHDEDGAVFKNSQRAVYDLFAHVILVTASRYRMFAPEAKAVLANLKQACRQIAADPYEISMMPDHAHMLVRWPNDIGGTDFVERIKATSGSLMRRAAFWSGGGYIGTVGPYSLKKAMALNRGSGWVAG